MEGKVLVDFRHIVPAAAVSFIAVLALGPVVLPFLRRLRVGQIIREEMPESHQQKGGIPTMGGLLFLAGMALALIFFGPRTPALGMAVIVTVGFGAVGFADDFIKVVLRRPLGLKARHKLFFQLALGSALAGYVFLQDLGTWVEVPFIGATFDLGPWYFPLVVLMIMATTNAVNITDGLDGLAAGSSIIALAFFLLAAASRGQADGAVFAASLAAGSAGFLFYNAHPAQVIMGDTGSLALGGGLAALAVLTKTELFLPLVGGLFVIEALSVIIQVAYFRLTGGRRLFLMSPLHHHFELKGWSEQRVVTVFWLAALGFGALGLLGMGM